MIVFPATGVYLTSMLPKRNFWILALVLLVATVAAYVPAIRDGGFVWDDDMHLTANPDVFAPNGLSAIWSQVTGRVQFYPLTFTTLWLQYRVDGLNPAGYHLVNVLLHAGNALLLWRLLRRLDLKGAFWIAALFALHPINVESVAWISERKNVLLALFYLLAASAYLRFESILSPAGMLAPKTTDVAPLRAWRYYALACLAFAAAILSKTVGCTFPAGMAVIIWWKRGRLTLRDLWPLLPLLVAGLLTGFYTAYLEKSAVGSVGEPWRYNMLERILIAGRASCFYVGKLLRPVDFAFSYPLWRVSAGVWWQYFFPAAVVAILAALWWLRHRMGRGVLAGVLFFLVTISPALGFVDYYTMIYSLVADHYVYIAAIGLFAAIVEPVARYASAAAPAAALAQRRTLWFHAGMAGILVTLGAFTFDRCFVYRDEETLWSDTLEKNPRSWLAYASLGVQYRKQGKPDLAMAAFKRALDIDPACVQALNGIGSALFDQGHVDEAEKVFTYLIAVRPELSKGYANLAAVRDRQGRPAEAEPLYQRAIVLDAYDPVVRFNYGRMLAKYGQVGGAASMFEQVLALNAENAEAHLYLGRCLAQQGQFVPALEHMRQALRLRPDWAEAQRDAAAVSAMLNRPR